MKLTNTKRSEEAKAWSEGIRKEREARVAAIFAHWGAMLDTKCIEELQKLQRENIWKIKMYKTIVVGVSFLAGAAVIIIFNWMKS